MPPPTVPRQKTSSWSLVQARDFFFFKAGSPSGLWFRRGNAWVSAEMAAPIGSIWDGLVAATWG